jgi:hypothetical protein
LACRVGTTHRYGNRRWRWTQRLGKTTDQPVEEVRDFVT